MTPPAVDDFTALVLHLLAHVHTRGPEDLFDRRYVAWVQQTAEPEHRDALDEAVELLAGLHAVPDGVLGVQIWPELFSSIEQLLAAPIDFGALGVEHVHSEAVRRSLSIHHAEPAVCMHRAVIRAAPSFARWHHSVAYMPSDSGGTPAWADAVRCMPSLLEHRVQWSRSLGPRGRALPSRIIVGGSMPWNELDPYVPAVVALHELSVIEAAGDRYEQTEWAALVALSRRLQSASEGLCSAHVAWLAALDLRAIVGALQDTGMLDEPFAESLLAEPSTRAERLRQLR